MSHFTVELNVQEGFLSLDNNEKSSERALVTRDLDEPQRYRG